VLATHQRSARRLFGVYAVVALLLAQLPPVFPPYHPALRAPVWLAIAALSATLTALLIFRPTTPRAVLLVLGWLVVILTFAEFRIGDIFGLFCAWLAVPALGLLAGRLSRRPRQALLAVHVITSAAWLGIAVMFVALSVLALRAANVRDAQTIYETMAFFDQTMLPIANMAATTTGFALGVTTKWGIVRHWWVVIKVVISFAVLGIAFGFLHDALERSASQAADLAAVGGTVADITSSGQVVLGGFVLALVSLVGAMLLSLYKPRGVTPWGRRSEPARVAAA
jgi:hypothetical protein